MKSSYQIKVLLEKYVNNTCSEDELMQLQILIEDPTNAQRLDQELFDRLQVYFNGQKQLNPALSNEILKNINYQIERRTPLKSRFWKIRYFLPLLVSL